MRYELDRTKFLDSHELGLLKNILSKYRNRDTLLIELALVTGARAGELLALTKDRIFPKSNSILILASKGSKNREIPLRPKLFKELLDYSNTVEGDLIFNISYRRLLDLWHHYRPVVKSFHSLRHTFAVNLYSKTKDIKLVQLALGHRSPTTTAIYTDFSYSLEQMRRIL